MPRYIDTNRHPAPYTLVRAGRTRWIVVDGNGNTAIHTSQGFAHACELTYGEISAEYWYRHVIKSAE